MTKMVKVLYGPTASGKSAAALKYAEKGNITIINADAMQCYNALHTLTAQPDAEEQNAAPHKLYGFVDASKNMIVTDWIEFAIKEIESSFQHNRQPVLVGGTGFYIKVLMEGLSEIPEIPENVRNQAIHIFETQGLEPLVEDLKAHNAADLEKLDIYNSRRVIRAWEVLKHTGKSLQDWQKENDMSPPTGYNFDIELVTRPREELIERINTRFDHMIEHGILDEVKNLSERIDNGEVPETNLIIKAHGFRPLRAYLKGDMSLEDAIERSKIETRQYAKRQMTWARQQFGFET